MLAELAPMIDGKPDVARLTQINLEELGRRFRTQKIIFATASDLYDQMRPTWKGNRDYLLAQLIRLVERFVESGNIEVQPALFNQDDLRRRIVITLNMSKIVQDLQTARQDDARRIRRTLYGTREDKQAVVVARRTNAQTSLRVFRQRKAADRNYSGANRGLQNSAAGQDRRLYGQPGVGFAQAYVQSRHHVGLVLKIESGAKG
jgi:hypothetical protein